VWKIKMESGEGLHAQGLALVASLSYREALILFERASEAGYGPASFEAAMAYQWGHYGTHWYRGDRWARSHELLKKAALEQNYLPALAHLWLQAPESQIDPQWTRRIYGSNDEYAKLWLCYGLRILTGSPEETQAFQERLWQQVIARNLPHISSHRFCTPSMLEWAAKRGMTWAQHHARHLFSAAQWPALAWNGLFFEGTSEVLAALSPRIWWENMIRQPNASDQAKIYFKTRIPLTMEETYYMGKAAIAMPNVFAGNSAYRPYWRQLGQRYVKAMAAVWERIVCWLLCAPRLGIFRDVAKLIGRRVWAAREEQMGSVPRFRRKKRRKSK
jgi:hypothetical protein